MLRELSGFDSDIDQYHSNVSWPSWMEERIEWADRVLVVCSENYLRRWKGQERKGVGLGAQWESLLTKQHLYENPGLNEKFIPVVFHPDDTEYIPTPLRDVSRVVLGENITEFGKLHNRILGIPPSEKPPIRTSRSPIATASGFFSSSNGKGERHSYSSHQVGLRPDKEKLFSNLFPARYPDFIYQAKAKLKNSKKFIELFFETWKSLGNRPPAPLDFFCERGIIYSFSAFDSPIWKLLEKNGDVWMKGRIPSADWSLSTNFAQKNRFIQLLNRSLSYLCENNESPFRVVWSKKMKCYLFSRKDDLLEGTIKTKAIHALARRTVFSAIKNLKTDDPRSIQHWKHVAFRHQFVRYDDQWYMALTPFWAFTSDGFRTPSKWQKKSSSNMQKPERNRAVLGHVMFWASILCKEIDLLEDGSGFHLQHPLGFEVSPSINDSDWTKVADKKDRDEMNQDAILADGN